METEVKLRVANSRALRRSLHRLGFRLEKRELERDVVLDTSDRALMHSSRLLRLRRHGRDWKLTFKGPPGGDVRYKSRPETETELADGNRFLRIMEQLGLREVFRYEKRRSTYRPQKGRAVVTLDVTPIGVFVELEGPRGWIDRTARALGYSREDYITKSYGQLYREYCRAGGREPTNMVFRK